MVGCMCWPRAVNNSVLCLQAVRFWQHGTLLMVWRPWKEMLELKKQQFKQSAALWLHGTLAKVLHAVFILSPLDCPSSPALHAAEGLIGWVLA